MSLDQLRATFADGISAAGAELLLETRAHGHAWEAVTEAVARGLADHHGIVLEPAPVRRPSPPGLLMILDAMLLYVCLRPVLGFGHEVVVALLAQLLHAAVGSGGWEPAIRLVGIDPIYAGAAIRAAGGIEVTGLAITGPLGAALHAALPTVFLASDQVADGAGVSMVAAAGAPAIGRGLAAFGADAVWLAVGLWMFVRWRRTRWPLAMLGLFIQAQIAVNHLLDAQLSLADIDASGLPFAVALALPDGAWFTNVFDSFAPEPRALMLGGMLVVFGYGAAAGLVLLTWGISRLGRLRHQPTIPKGANGVPVRQALAALTMGLAIVTAWSPIGAVAVGESNWHAPRRHTLATRSPQRSGDVSGGPRHTLRLTGATRVTVVQTADAGWRYLVDGVPEMMRGVGYNPQYAALPEPDRRAAYQRDFSAMRRLGFNTMEGWFEAQFDSVTLDQAARNDLGVLMPFELNQDWSFEDPNVQQSILDHVSAYVEQYKNHPAVRMWAPGNENLHRILYARWVSQENVPAARARADAFAAFLPRLVDRIHELDPAHPVIYRDAEDVYLGRITAAFNQDGIDRPWLVYGANVYSTPRLQQIVARWPAQWPGHALVISEFAPGGVGPAERAVGFQQQWSIIRSRPEVLLGGLAYTWATNGPEDLDRVFGLVDPRGVPTDGALAALSSAYTSDAETVDAAHTLPK